MELQFLPHPVWCMTLFFSGYDIRVVLKVETKMPAVKLTDVGAYTSRSVMVFLIDHTIYRHKVLAQIPAKSVQPVRREFDALLYGRFYIFTTQRDLLEKQSRCKVVIPQLSNFEASQSVVGSIT